MVRLVMESESGSEEGGDRTCGAHKGWGWGPKPWQALTKGVVEAVLLRKSGVPVKSAKQEEAKWAGNHCLWTRRGLFPVTFILS